jgi:hypothetical protein
LDANFVATRRGYLHDSVSGAGKVVHYRGLAHGLRRGPVEEVPLFHFARIERPVEMMET